jgi:hypothetical protein
VTDTATVVPVKGMVWVHAKRKDYMGKPLTFKVTSIKPLKGKPTVYSAPHPYGGDRIKTPVAVFAKYCAEVVSVPDPTQSPTGPKLTDAECAALYAKAHEAGMAAGESCIPEPMVVVQRENPFDDNSRIVKEYAPVMDGLCGFAWITVFPGTGSFARWARKTGKGSAAYKGGTRVKWVREFNQSFERKSAYAHAFAEVLREGGVKAFSDSRLD